MSIRTLVIDLVFALFSAVVLIGMLSVFVDPAFATAESDDEQVLSGTHQRVQRLASSQVRVYDAQLEDAAEFWRNLRPAAQSVLQEQAPI